ncbi:MAG: hypothetical protein RL205_970 [Actinomycetota bacterium]
MTAVTVHPSRVLVVGSTGSVGRLVVEESVAAGYRVRALMRTAAQGRTFSANVEAVVGDLTRADTLAEAVAGVDVIIFTHGSNGTSRDMEVVDYGAVRNVLAVLGSQPARIVLMTLIGITNRESSYNRSTEGLDWKRRSERLVRASGRPYTIVRPGWFDYNSADESLPVLLQGDLRRSGTPRDGAISRRHIAQLIVASIECDAASHTTFELISTRGSTPTSLTSLFDPLDPDVRDSIDGVRDEDNMPMSHEPSRVQEDLAAVIAASNGRAT